jgi:hypothetical protein
MKKKILCNATLIINIIWKYFLNKFYLYKKFKENNYQIKEAF